MADETGNWAEGMDPAKIQQALLHKSNITRIDAKIKGLNNLSNAGDAIATKEVVDLKLMRAAECEAVTLLKAPKERIRILRQAL